MNLVVGFTYVKYEINCGIVVTHPVPEGPRWSAMNRGRHATRKNVMWRIAMCMMGLYVPVVGDEKWGGSGSLVLEVWGK